MPFFLQNLFSAILMLSSRKFKEELGKMRVNKVTDLFNWAPRNAARAPNLLFKAAALKLPSTVQATGIAALTRA